MRFVRLLAVVLACVSLGCKQAGMQAGAGEGSFFAPLSGIANPHGGRAMHEGSWDRGGGNADMRAVKPGETITLLDYNGAGIVRRFWVTIAPRSHKQIHRQAILRMYWDGEEKPSVECPVGDFFGVGFGEQKDYISLPLNETSGGYNCYWPMPFHKSARWTLENRSERQIDAFYYNIDFTAYDALPKETRHFHAQWRRENPTTAGQNYTILEAKGAGHYVGVALFMQAIKPGGLGFLEGDEMITIDDNAHASPDVNADSARKFFASPTTRPQIIGTGSEDYFSSGWYYDRGLYSAPYHGIVIKDDPPGRVSTYRWHIEDAMPFTKSIRVTIEHGHGRVPNDHQADYSSVAYYYQTEPHEAGPALPESAAALLPIVTPEPKRFPGVTEAEALVGKATATDGMISMQNMSSFAGEWSGDAQLFWTNATPGSILTMPINVPSAGTYSVEAYLTRAPDYGTVQALIDHQQVGGATDLYAEKVEATGPVRLGPVQLSGGQHELKLKITGKRAASTGFFVGIDCLKLVPSTGSGH